MVTFWPSKKPASPRPLRNACKTSPVSSGERALINPITGLAACCARAENGQAAAAPPRSVMKSRRLIAAPEASGQAIVSALKQSAGRGCMSALGQKQTCALQQAMSALHPIATAKADSRKRSCPLYPKSGHVRCTSPCPLCARSGHSPPHSITSSALASTAGGNVKLIALAVLRLITSSYLVGACTGRSAGFSPLRMRST